MNPVFPGKFRRQVTGNEVDHLFQNAKLKPGGSWRESYFKFALNSKYVAKPSFFQSDSKCLWDGCDCY